MSLADLNSSLCCFSISRFGDGLDEHAYTCVGIIHMKPAVKENLSKPHSFEFELV